MEKRKRLLVLYGANSVHTSTVKDYLEAFALYSEYEVSFADSVAKARIGIPFNFFDAILVHYSVRLCYPKYISSAFATELEAFNGPKILTIQDEYDHTETARIWMERLKFDLVLTCVPEEDIEKVYPRARFPKTSFKTILTGYVPEWLKKSQHSGPIANRKLDIVYRGRALHFVYGGLAREKELIGIGVKQRAIKAGLRTDIETADVKRIYGDQWFQFLASSKTTLGTESGANVFDVDGSIRTAVDEYVRNHRRATFEEVQREILKDAENKHATMNQISPKMFEAIACGTVLVMFTGSYSNILIPDRHFIALEKDYSNWPDVLLKLQDDRLLQNMADTAFREIIELETWSYRKFIQMVDTELSKLLQSKTQKLIPVTEEQVVYSLVGTNLNEGHIANCFNLPVHLSFIEDVETVRVIQPDGKLTDRGELLRLIWVLSIPRGLRNLLSVETRIKIKRLFHYRELE